MSVRSGGVLGRGIAKSGTVLMARVVGFGGVPILNATLASIAYVTRDLTAQTTGTQRTLTVASVVFDTLQTPAIDPAWTEDSTGYNFRYVVPAADMIWTPALDVAGNPIPHSMQGDVRFVPISGEPFVVPFYWWALPVWIV